MAEYRVVEIDDPSDPLIDELHQLCVRIDSPHTRCAPGAGIPELEMMRRSAHRGDGVRLWAVLDVAFDEPVAMVITGSDGEFQWLKAEADVIGLAASIAGKHITNTLGVRAWGVMRNDDIRRAIDESSPDIGCDDVEKRVWWGG